MGAQRRAARWRWTVPLLGLALALGGDAARDHGRTASAAQPSERRLELAVVALAARIGRDRVRSTGVVLDARRGLVATTAHSLWGATSLKIATGLAVLHGRIVARNPCDDIALVETQPRLPGLAHLSPGARRPALPERRVVALRRQGLAPRGTIAAVRVGVGASRASARIDPRLPASPDELPLEGRLESGDSGAPLVDGRRRLVGLVRTGPAGAAALPWGSVRARLDELEPGRRAIFTGWRHHYRCAPRLHGYASAEHPGFRRVDARLDAPVPATRLPGTERLNR
jgi:hypothetical protein